MSKFKFKVGDRIQKRDWPDSWWFDVTHVGDCWMVGVDQLGSERVFLHGNGWVRVPKLKPEPFLYAAIMDETSAAAAAFAPGRSAGPCVEYAPTGRVRLPGLPDVTFTTIEDFGVSE